MAKKQLKKFSKLGLLIGRRYGGKGGTIHYKLTLSEEKIKEIRKAFS